MEVCTAKNVSLPSQFSCSLPQRKPTTVTSAQHIVVFFASLFLSGEQKTQNQIIVETVVID